MMMGMVVVTMVTILAVVVVAIRVRVKLFTTGLIMMRMMMGLRGDDCDGWYVGVIMDDPSDDSDDDD